MKKREWMRVDRSLWPSAEDVRDKEKTGWRLVAVEWEREIEVADPKAAPGAAGFAEQIPFGTRIADDCRHLEADPIEMQVLNQLAEMIVLDLSYKEMADALNQNGLRTRDGKDWTALGVFKLTPRLIEVTPQILSGAEWESRKKQLARVTWNS